MSEFFTERDAELNDAKERAKRSIERGLQQDVDEDLLDRYLRIFADIDDLEEVEEPDRKEREIAFSEGLAEIGSELPEGVEATYIEAIVRTTRRSIGSRFLHSSLLMILVGELEMFINQLARASFEARPTALDQGERQLTWAEISSFDSIDALRDRVVDKTVDDLLRGSLQDWVEFFESKFGINQITAARSFDAVEAVQRRHCIVHNAGHVSQQYLDKLGEKNVSVELHDLLEVDDPYVQKTADILFLVAYSLAWAIAMKVNPDPEWRDELVSTFANRTFYLLQDRRYSLVASIGESVPLDKMKGESGEYSAFIIQVNRWIALKEAGKFELARKEVEELPVATRSDHYKLAKYALLDEKEQAHEVAQRMIRNDELSRSHMLTWPLLRGVRDYARSLDTVDNEPQASSIRSVDD